MDPSHHPLRDGNRFQRAYYRWALPHYERIGCMDPELRQEVEQLDLLLYTRRGRWAWLGWSLGLGGCVMGLSATSMPVWMAFAISLGVWLGLSFGLLAAWLAPYQTKAWKGGSALRKFVMGMLAGAVAAVVGFVVGHVHKRGELDVARVLGSMERALPGLLLFALGLSLLLAAVAWASRMARRQRLQSLSLLAERDAARALAAETELRLLQAQIHPHFIFNTLATLQHWVDKRDERAGPLLRELTGFLRRSTEMLGRPQVPLAEEAQAVAHYLAILQARQGDRLGFDIAIEPRTAAQLLPPGLLLTLVENAVEHGLETKIGGGRVTVTSACEGTGWWLRVDDDGLGLSPTAQDNVGLSNLRQRLQQHFQGRAHFRLQARAEGGARAEIIFEDAPCPAS